MIVTRRTFGKGALAVLAAAVGPWSLAGRKGYAATADTPALKFLTPSEYKYINAMAREIIPDEPLLSGQVDPAKNLDWFFSSDNAAPDFLIMMQYLRLIRLADSFHAVGLLKRMAPPTYEDILSFKKTIAALGYYSDANGEADLPPEKRVVWPRIGYGGPKPEDWFPPDSEVILDRSKLVDRIKAAGL
jgi:hypothetical protein